MEFIICKKIKLFNCEDIFIVEEINDNLILVCKIRTGNKAWIKKLMVEKIYE
jgi:hypothetical protein